MVFKKDGNFNQGVCGFRRKSTIADRHPMMPFIKMPRFRLQAPGPRLQVRRFKKRLAYKHSQCLEKPCYEALGFRRGASGVWRLASGFGLEALQKSQPRFGFFSTGRTSTSAAMSFVPRWSLSKHEK